MSKNASKYGEDVAQLARSILLWSIFYGSGNVYSRCSIQVK